MQIKVALILISLCAAVPTLTAAEVEYYPGHKFGIRDMRLSPDGKLLATVAGDGQIIVRKTNDLGSKQVLKFDDRAFDTLCFAKDNHHVLATGSLENLQELTDGYMKFDLRDSSRKFVNFQLLGSIHNFNLTDNETHATYLCADKLCHLNLKTSRFSAATPLPKPRLHTAVAVSPDSQYYAFLSPTESVGKEDGEVVTRWIEPCRLVVMRPSGEKVASQLLPAQPKLRNALLHFVDPQRLLICQGTNRISTWTVDAKGKKWNQLGPSVDAPEALYTAIDCGLTDDICWLGSEHSVIAVDLKTGKIVQQVELKATEESDHAFSNGPITNLTVLRPQKRVVVSLWDGQIAAIAASF